MHAEGEAHRERRNERGYEQAGVDYGPTAPVWPDSPHSARVRCAAAFHYPLGLAFGVNRSVEVWGSTGHDIDASDRWLDPGVDPDGSKHSVVLEQVDDPNGPFNGDWYVAAEHLNMDRIIAINTKLLGGPVYNHNRSPSLAADLALIVTAARLHERVHTQLASARLHDLSLLPKLEQAMGTDRERLLSDTNDIIRGAETDLEDASSEANVAEQLSAIYGTRSVSILVPRSENTDQYTLWTGVLATIGAP
jgi:hypothetical protein